MQAEMSESSLGEYHRNHFTWLKYKNFCFNLSLSLSLFIPNGLGSFLSVTMYIPPLGIQTQNDTIILTRLFFPPREASGSVGDQLRLTTGQPCLPLWGWWGCCLAGLMSPTGPPTGGLWLRVAALQKQQTHRAILASLHSLWHKQVLVFFKAPGPLFVKHGDYVTDAMIFNLVYGVFYHIFVTPRHCTDSAWLEATAIRMIDIYHECWKHNGVCFGISRPSINVDLQRGLKFRGMCAINKCQIWRRRWATYPLLHLTPPSESVLQHDPTNCSINVIQRHWEVY